MEFVETLIACAVIALLGGPLLFALTIALQETWFNPGYWRSEEVRGQMWANTILLGFFLILFAVVSAIAIIRDGWQPYLETMQALGEFFVLFTHQLTQGG
jgi:hypothetical protein